MLLVCSIYERLKYVFLIVIVFLAERLKKRKTLYQHWPQNVLPDLEFRILGWGTEIVG